jgi:hypothetical protein
MEEAYSADPHKITNYGGSREERVGERGRKQGMFRRGRGREYRDLDDPDNTHSEKPGTKPINFLDI